MSSRAARRFSLGMAIAVAITLAVSYALYAQDWTYTDNDRIRKQQLAKLAAGTRFSTIVVGDSSAGNALDASVIAGATGRPAANLALTGSYGLTGSLNMLRHAVKAGAPDTALIVHSLDIWRRPFALQAYFETEQGLPRLQIEHPFLRDKTTSDYLQYVVNPQEIYWFLRSRVRPVPLTYRVDEANDYLAQHADTIASGRKTVEAGARLDPTIHPDNETLLELLDAYCGTLATRCVFAHGPIYRPVAERSGDAIAAVNRLLASKTRHIRVIADVPMMEQASMGDSTDHVLPSAKAEVTRWYLAKLETARSPAPERP